jgi:predicted transcriptional regulator
MGKDAYQALTSRFEGSGGLPLPPGKNGPITEWFKYWLTEEEAEFLRQLPWLTEPATLEAIAEKLGMAQAETAKALETLTEKTLVIGGEVPTEEGEVRYFGLSSIFFFLESYLNRYYDDHLDDPDEIHANLGHWFEELKRSEKMEPKAKEMRIIPIAKAVEDPRGSVSTYDAIQLIETSVS